MSIKILKAIRLCIGSQCSSARMNSDICPNLGIPPITLIRRPYPADLEVSFVEEFVEFTSIIASSEDKTLRHMSGLLRKDIWLLLPSSTNVAIALRIQ